MTFASMVDWDALLTVVWASLLAGVGVTAAFGLALLGGTRALEHSREGSVVGATLFGVIGALASVAVIAAIVFAIVVLSE